MNQNTTPIYEFNIQTLVTIINKWRKKIFLFLIAVAILSSILLLLKPNVYYSFATAIPTNAILNDKSYIFNDKIDGLYSSLGAFNDLDRLKAIAETDTTYKYLIQKFNLLNHYKVKNENNNIAIQKAIKLMKEEKINFEKTEGGLLKIHVWDYNADTAATMANDILQYTEKSNRQLQIEYNKNNFNIITEHINLQTKLYHTLQDSISKTNNSNDRKLLNISTANILSDINEAEKIKKQYELTIQLQQPSLRIVENASPNYKHVKPKRLYSFISTMMLACCAIVLLIIIIESIGYNLSSKVND